MEKDDSPPIRECKFAIPVRPRMGLGDKTAAAQAASISVEGQDRWQTLIRKTSKTLTFQNLIMTITLLPTIKCVIILAGARNSGKTTTLRHIARQKLETVPNKGRTYSLSGQRIRIYISSPQEQCKFCKCEKIIGILEGEIKNAAGADCTMLIVPFTMGMNQERTKLNELCIREPIRHLKLRGLDVQLVYLRKDATNKVMLKLMDDLMKDLASREIRSNSRDQREQVDQLWAIITEKIGR